MPPLLVTGAHRTGTTWVGKMLAQAPSLAYVHEPFNPTNTSSFLEPPENYWFPYVTGHTEDEYVSFVERILHLRYPIVRSVLGAESLGAAWYAVRRALQFGRHRLHGRSVLLKDPLAVLSSEWIAERFDARVVVLVRHPAAFADSLRRKGWRHPFGDFLEQPALMEDHFDPYRKEIKRFAREERDLIDQSGLLWTLIYSVVETYQSRHSDWVVLRHEDIARDPVSHFESLYDELGLDFTSAIRSTVEQHSQASNPVHADQFDQIQRDSRAVVEQWKGRLSNAEVTRLQSLTRPLADQYYDPEEWQIA